MNKTIENTRQYLKNLFKNDKRAWVVAYSGGKDSTLVLQLVVELLHELDKSMYKPVYVLTTDTRVEAPNIKNYMIYSLKCISRHADEYSLPLETILVKPRPEESFWGNLIGKGYPSPTRWFRWCTSKMKIKPARRVIDKITKQYGSVILLLGTRKDESSSRKMRMEKRDYNEQKLNFHHEIPNALVASPIAEWTNQMVWDYLMNNNPPPWGEKHNFMFDLYSQAAGGECPVIFDLNTPSCGGSRFGCWTCTVVKHDKSMEGFISAGESEMLPLSQFRNLLKSIREEKKHRLPYKRNQREGIGPFNYETRKMLLNRLLSIEKEINEELLDDSEIEYIQSIWNQDFDFENSALKIAHSFGREVDMPKNSSFLMERDQKYIEELCKTYEVQQELVEALLNLVDEKHKNLDAWGARPGLERDVGELIEKAVEQIETADLSHDH